MPELPEVETIRRQLEPLLVGATIVDAWAFPSPKFDDAVQAIGSTVTDVRRRGKYLLSGLVGDRGPSELIVHLGMTGRLGVAEPGPDRRADSITIAGSTSEQWAHLRATWSLDDGRTLLFDDVRRFGRIAVVRAGEHDSLPTLAALGPEPFDERFTPELLRTEVNRHQRAVKTQLLSQRVVAGVGNIYADEALWSARVHPAARRLTKVRAAALRDSIRDVLAAGIDNGGTTLRNYRDAEGGSGQNQRFLECYGRGGEPCSRCGDLLRRTVIDARSTSFCPTCQRK